MNRSRRYVLISHCLLNVNAKVDGYGLYPGALEPLVLPLIKSGIGIFQLPCPEATFAGARRWGMTVEQYDIPAYRRHSRWLLEQVVDQVEDDLANGVSVLGVVGVDGSPSCGVDCTCYGYTGGMIGGGDAVARSVESGRMGSGQGVFMKVLSDMFKERDIALPFAAVDEENPEELFWNSIELKLGLNSREG
ncbi:2-thiouracil desulfurase family protein [Dethiosulfovibrio sp. F2B]|uniref:CD3072 family TudS-related putative desulfidase n=1 Tax=Dethiosulfovibrio faecalis TaxID=2720018 RepID=UPI001F3EEB7D|nr:2-thiouracil desulfurase family protein [Dethiosulfovibrio faecalis]